MAASLFGVHPWAVITREQLLERLNGMVERKEIKNVDIARALDLPDSRIPALLRGERRIYLDEATRLVQAFGLEQDEPAEPLQLGVLRLAVRHVARRLNAPLNEPLLEDLAEDLRAFSQFVLSPSVRESVEAAEGFFQALSYRPRRPAEEVRPESDHAPNR